MNVLVTGASGSLGRHLVEALVARGHRVTGVMRSAASARDFTATTARPVVADLTAAEGLGTEWFRQDCVVHTAASVGDACRSRDHVEADRRATAAMLSGAVRAGCPRFIHLSSIAVHDLPADGSVVSETTPLNDRPEPWNHYVRAKLACERLVTAEHQSGRLEATIIRPSVFLGRYDRHTTPRILHLLRSPLAGVIGDGENLVPCVDLAELAALVATAAGSQRAVGRTYDVSGRSHLTQRELLASHAAATGRPLRRRYPRRVAHAMATVLEGAGRLTAATSPPLLTRFMVAVATLNCRIDSSRAAADLGWRGHADLTRTIHDAVTWTREQAA
jgi:nucleoside-diphosphate-sugar epimerase